MPENTRVSKLRVNPPASVAVNFPQGSRRVASAIPEAFSVLSVLARLSRVRSAAEEGRRGRLRAAGRDAEAVNSADHARFIDRDLRLESAPQRIGVALKQTRYFESLAEPPATLDKLNLSAVFGGSN